MKQKESNKSVTFGAVEDFNTVISAGGSGFLVALLRDKLYSDKRKVTVFETWANAVDANRQVGATRNVEIILTRTNLIIRDHGPGCSRETMQNVYFAYCNSSKSGSNDDIGGYGIGSKSPSAYSDAYFVISNHGGMSTMYMSVINGNTNKVSVMHSIPLDDPTDTGLTVKVPINDTGSLSEELNIFRALILDGLVFRTSRFGSDCVDFYDATRYDDDLDDWDARSPEEREECRFSYLKEIEKALSPEEKGAGVVPSTPYSSIQAVQELVDRCPYFAKRVGGTGTPDAPVRLYADIEDRPLTYGQLAEMFEKLDAKLAGIESNRVSLDTIQDSDVPEEWMAITRKYNLDYVPGAGFVFAYEVKSPFYRSHLISNSMVLACDGDMSYGIPGELAGKYGRSGLLGRASGGMHTVFLAEFDRDELTIQPSREVIAADQALDDWLLRRCKRFEAYYTVKCGVLSMGLHLGTDCLLHECAKRANDYLSGEFVPCSDSLVQTIKETVRSKGAQSAYSGAVDLSKVVTRTLAPRRAMYNESGKFVLDDEQGGDSAVKRFDVRNYYAIAVVNDDPDVDLASFKLLYDDLDVLCKANPGNKALMMFKNELKSAGDSTNPGNFKVYALLVDAGSEAEFMKATSVFRREPGVSGFLDGVDLIRVSSIMKERAVLGYYERIVNVDIKEVQTFSHKYKKYLEDKGYEATDAPDEAAVKAARAAAAPAGGAADKPEEPAKKKAKAKKRKATGSSTLTQSKPVSQMVLNGVRSKNGTPATVEELDKEWSAKPEIAGDIDWSGFTDTVMVPAGFRFKNTDALTRLLLRTVGDSSDSMCCGRMMRALLGVRHIVRVLPSEAERLASEKGWEMWYDFDYLARVQHVVDTVSMTFIPSLLTSVAERMGLPWLQSECHKINTFAANASNHRQKLVKLGGAQGAVPLRRVFTCIMHILSCIENDVYYGDFCRSAKKGDTPGAAAALKYGFVGGIQFVLKGMEDECLAAIRCLDAKSAGALAACAEAYSVRRDPCLSGLLPGGAVVQKGAVDSKRSKGYNVLVKLMAPFNKPLDIRGLIGAVGPCKSNVR